MSGGNMSYYRFMLHKYNDLLNVNVIGAATQPKRIVSSCQSICYRRNGSIRRIRGSVSPPGQISPARWNGTRDEHKHLDRVYAKQICSCFLKERLISLQFL